MKHKLIVCFLAIILFACKEAGNKPLVQNSEKEHTPTTYYFIRHAEKDRSNPLDNNPHLTESGLIRAQDWAKLFQDVDFDAVYTTNFIRTKETALPTALQNKLELSFYNPKSMDIKAFLKATKGQAILIVGHSESTPNFVNAVLNENKYQAIDDSVFNTYFIVTVNDDGTITDSKLVMP